MDVIDVAREVGIVADGVLPIAALPNSLFAPGDLLRLLCAFSAKPQEKPCLIRLQRREKSASFGGKAQMTCM